MANLRGFRLPLNKLKITFFMRTKLDEDWVLHLALLLEEGEKLRPIEVRAADAGGFYEVIHGRHRIAAHELAHLDKIPATIKKISARKAVIKSFEESVDTKAPLPLKKRDIVHSIITMYDKGMGYGDVMKSLRKKWSYPVCKKYLTEAQSNMRKRRITQAMDFYRENPDDDLGEIAKKFNLRPAALLKEWERGNEKPMGFPEAKGVLTNKQRSLVRSIRNTLSRVRMAFTEGEATEGQVRDLMNHTIYLQEELEKVVLDEKARVSSAVLQL